jgi:plasmid stabilization system protein ParE
MSRIKYSPRYLIDAARLDAFLATQQGNDVADRAVKTIDTAIDFLVLYPESYKSTKENPKLREMGIDFQSKGYMLLYSYTKATDTVTLLAMKHQLEDDYNK